MSIPGLTAEDIAANIRRATARKDAALAEYEAAKAELAWWRDALRLVDPAAAVALEAEHESTAIVTELFPDRAVFDDNTRPTLRQAIVLMREDARRSWTINDLAQAQHDWLPARADATKRVSDMAGNMYAAGQLSRLDRGVYKLAPPLAAALDTADGPRK